MLIDNDSCQHILDVLKAIYMLQRCAVQDIIYLIETRQTSADATVMAIPSSKDERICLND